MKNLKAGLYLLVRLSICVSQDGLSCTSCCCMYAPKYNGCSWSGAVFGACLNRQQDGGASAACAVVQHIRQSVIVAHHAGRKVVEKSDLVATFPRPEKPIQLYEFEGCPFCRKVRLLRKHLFSYECAWPGMSAANPVFWPQSCMSGVAPRSWLRYGSMSLRSDRRLNVCIAIVRKWIQTSLLLMSIPLLDDYNEGANPPQTYCEDMQDNTVLDEDTAGYISLPVQLAVCSGG